MGKVAKAVGAIVSYALFAVTKVPFFLKLGNYSLELRDAHGGIWIAEGATLNTREV